MRRFLTMLAIGLLASAGIAHTEDRSLFPIARYGDDWMKNGVDIGFIDQAGTVVMPLTKEYLPLNLNSAAGYFSEGLQPVQIGRASKWPATKWGYLDRNFRMAIEPKFEYAQPFSEGLAAARENAPPWNFGYIDPQGEFVIPPQFEDAGPFSEGVALAKRREDRLSGYIDRRGHWVVPPQYSAVSSVPYFSEGMACVSKELENPQKPGAKEFIWGYIDKSGKQVIEFKFEQASAFREAIAVVRVKEGYGYIDRSGEFVIPPRFRLAWEFTEGLARVTTTEGRMAYIDRKGDVVFLVPEVSWADPFAEGLANVRIWGKSGKDLWGYIDRTGKVSIPAEFQSAEPFRDGLARATRDGETGYIDKTGQFVWKTKVPSDIWPNNHQTH